MDTIRTLTCSTSLLALLVAAMPALAQDTHHTPRPHGRHLTAARVTSGTSTVHRVNPKRQRASTQAAAQDARKTPAEDAYVPYDGPWEQR